jgi:hypothetical protein
MTFPPESEAARERLRREHGVRLVESHEEGYAAENLAPGVYGFTGSPALASPLFAVPRYRNFEVHRRRNGEVVLLAFVSDAEFERLASAAEVVHVTAFPDVDGTSTKAVAIPYARIVHHRQYSVRNAPGIALEVRPIGQEAAV